MNLQSLETWVKKCTISQPSIESITKQCELGWFVRPDGSPGATFTEKGMWLIYSDAIPVRINLPE